MAVPNIFGSATSAIPLSQLDQNFATAITLGNTAVYLGNTTTSLGNVTLTNVTISSGNVSVSTATVGAGSNTAPAITTTGDTNTGIFFPAADTIAFSEGGVESARIDSAGNFGLGVTPSAWGGSFKALQVGLSTSLYNNTTGNGTFLGSNFYWNGSNNIYINSNFATAYGQTSGSHQWFTAATGTAGNTISFTQAMTLDADGDLGIGTTSPAQKLHVAGNVYVTGDTFRIKNSASNTAFIRAEENASTAAYTYATMDGRATGYWAFSTNDTERARIDSSGNFMVGKTTTDLTTAGVAIESSGVVGIGTNTATPMFINRQGSDGTLIEFRQANVGEGTISVSGTTVTYGGGHLARFGQLPDGSEEPTLLKGTVLTNLDEMCVWINKETGIPADNEQCNKVKISDVDGDANVAGVFVSWSYDEQHDTNDLFVAMTGDMIIRIAQGTTVQRGDLLMSAGDGTAKPQGDDIVRSKTVAKVTSNHVTCTYADGSYCVPCVLMAC